MGATVRDSPSSLPHRPHSHNVFTLSLLSKSVSQPRVSLKLHSSLSIALPKSLSTSRLSHYRSQYYPRNTRIYGFKRESSENLTFDGDDDSGDA